MSLHSAEQLQRLVGKGDRKEYPIKTNLAIMKLCVMQSNWQMYTFQVSDSYLGSLIYGEF